MTIPTFAGGAPDAARLAPSPVYLSGEEALRITSVGNAAGVTVQVSGRILRPDNTRSPILFQHVPNSTRTVVTTIVALSEGWLLGLDIRVLTGAPASNAVWMLVELVSGGGAAVLPLQALAADFVSTNSPLMWPGGIVLDPLDGAGCLRAIVGSTPGAGAEFSETVPTAARWELLSLQATLTTNATVANRIPMLTLDDGANINFGAPVNGNETAGVGWLNAWGQGVASVFSAVVAASCNPLPVNLRLGAGARIRSVTNALQAGDQWSSPKYLVREWFDV